MMAPQFWQRVTPLSLALWPLSVVYRMLFALRRLLHVRQARLEKPLGVPLVVVGNLSVGGSGKTPLTVRLAEVLHAAGLTPAILCSGYGGASTSRPQMVHADSDPAAVGDEAVLLARRAGCPVAAARVRMAAARHLLAAVDVDARPDVLLSDDGLQHYRMPRDLEIAVCAGFGNGFCLPAGPLRETLARLRTVDLSVTFGKEFKLVPECFVNVSDNKKTQPLSAFAGRAVNAIAGTAAPQRFFDQLQSLDITVTARAFPDHHRYKKSELPADDLPLLMTEKDAVKCESFTDATGERDWWFLKVNAATDAALEKEFLRRVMQLTAKKNEH